ncbi:hypothetical protein AVEN_247213-1 [Araneus ventricosus]|uniref:Uncharacterized protein n=1 Tax=Araneus ventricosus TaxID=182803 RepID=A0A4Y2QYR2_ARAVE|nr:hypothetical protein AVEN_247213-1 [Araneus ventricosus]
MRRQVEFYSSMQDAKKVQLCARTISYKHIWECLLHFHQTRPRPRPRERMQHEPIHIGDVQASVVVQMIAVLPERNWSLTTDFLHLKLHAAC